MLTVFFFQWSCLTDIVELFKWTNLGMFYPTSSIMKIIHSASILWKWPQCNYWRDISRRIVTQIDSNIDGSGISIVTVVLVTSLMEWNGFFSPVFFFHQKRECVVVVLNFKCFYLKGQHWCVICFVHVIMIAQEDLGKWSEGLSFVWSWKSVFF